MLKEAETVVGMAFLRFLAGSIELTAAFLMLRFGKIGVALQINGVLGLIGPIVLMVVSLLGIAGLAGHVPPLKLLVIGAGVLLIMIGVRM